MRERNPFEMRFLSIAIKVDNCVSEQRKSNVEELLSLIGSVTAVINVEGEVAKGFKRLKSGRMAELL